jgi:hypothetical protein
MGHPLARLVEIRGVALEWLDVGLELVAEIRVG